MAMDKSPKHTCFKSSAIKSVGGPEQRHAVALAQCSVLRTSYFPEFSSTLYPLIHHHLTTLTFANACTLFIHQHLQPPYL